MSLQLPLALEAESERSLQAQIFDQIRSMILDGRLRLGDPLPASRLLSEQMGVSRNTTILAYERLLSEGYIETKPSVGTFVSPTLPDKALRSEYLPLKEGSNHAAKAPLIQFSGRVQSVFNPHGAHLDQDFWVGRPDADTFPRRAWKRLLCEQISKLGAGLTAYGGPEGYQPLRKAIASYLGPARGIAAAEDQIIIVGGSQDGLNLIARLLLGPDTVVALEQPCYQGAAYVFESFNADIRPIPVDADGLQVELLEDVGNAIVYVTPSHQYPTGAMLTPERRQRLLDWAAATGSSVIEDDYDSDFRYDGSPLTALKGLDAKGNVIYLGTFSKSIGAGIRLGYLVVPESLIEPARRLKSLMNNNGQPILEQAVLAEFMNQDGYSRHLRTIRH
ncbi:MAG: PLP-dependent aminotransferase family protein, partial [Geminicoccaceae bacterium]